MSTTTDAAEQRRKLALLEARLNATENSTTTPVTPAAPPRAQPPPVSIGSLSGSAFDSSDDEERVNPVTTTGTPSSAQPPPPLPPPRSTNARRNYAPPPARDSKNVAPSAQIEEKDTPSLRARAAAPTPTAPRKRRRTTSSPSTMRNSRLDSYFKPRSRDSSKDCIPLSSRTKSSPNNGTSTATAAAEVLRASTDAFGEVNSTHNTPATHPTASPTVSTGGVKRALSFISPGGGGGGTVSNANATNPGECTPPSASSAMASNNAGQTNTNTNQVGSSSTIGNADDYRHLRNMIERLKDENKQIEPLESKVKQLEAENEDLSSQVEVELPMLREQASAAAAQNEQSAKQLKVLSQALRDAVVATAKMERSEARRRVAAMGQRVGRLGVERTRTSLQEVWEEGSEWKEISSKLKAIQAERESIDKKRRDIAKQKRKANEDDAETPFESSAVYVAEQEEIYRVQLQVLKREETGLVEQRSRLVRERDVLVRELRRQSDEDISAFNKFQTVNDRYVALNLLGRGGFSEVYKAFDLVRGCYVACKIHQLASNWSEVKKRTFIRHSMREYEIHKALRHPRVVQLIDIFEIDENTFCTVLEFCDGSDLDSYLRAHQTLPEREARSIIGQVCSGLLYLSEQRKRIIHYDLKPGNILFHNGEVRIADFGLSKIMGEGDTTQMGVELTSQGAGTMWYLPPECFETGTKPRISSKVDVWSAGVILYQMLYGKKPFGHDQSQEKMFREKTVAHQELRFPAKPVVSDMGKQFMAACLTRNASARPAVADLVQHPFLKRK